MSHSRQLAAIMFTDIVGYSALMGHDEKVAFSLLAQSRKIQKPIIAQFHGRWIKEMGDGAIASFYSASDALAAAVKIQEACLENQELNLKIGIHLGEVVFEDGDLFGDGVNIASRIESLATAGSILISKSIRNQVKNKSHFKLVSLGFFDFKNIADPIEVFAVANPGLIVPKRENMQGKLKPKTPKSNKPKWIAGIVALLAIVLIIWFMSGKENSSTTENEKSIAVLAFADMSQAKDQEYFGDGLSENLIDLLAKVPSLKVIGRTSSFSFKGKNEDLRSIGKKLGVNHIVEGSVQKNGNQLRITAQLVRTDDGFHLWSDKFDTELKDIFKIQDEISQAILNSIKIKLLDDEVNDVFKKYTDNVEAYELYLKARYHVNKFTPDGFLTAIKYFDEAIAVDPDYAIAYADKAFCYMNLKDFGWLTPEQSDLPARESATRAFELDDQIAESHLAVGRIKLHWDWKIEEAVSSFKNALEINPNSAQGHVQLGMSLALLGKNQEALEHATTAETLDPISILNLWYLTVIPIYIGEHEMVLANGKKMIELEPQAFSGYMWAGMGCLGLKRYEEAVTYLESMTNLAPGVFTTGMLAMAHGIEGNLSKAKNLLLEMEKMSEGSIEASRSFGDVYIALGERDKAYLAYNSGIDNGEGRMLWVKATTHFCPDCLKDPEFQQILDRLGVYY